MSGATAFGIAIFALILLISVYILIRTSRRMTTVSHFWAAGHSVSAPRNGVAMSGDFLGATTMLGSVGLIMLYGFDGGLYSLGWLVGFITVLLFVGERLRNVGRFTLSDALAIRLRENPMRITIAVPTVIISTFLMFVQVIAGGVLLNALIGLAYPVGVVITGLGIAAYVLSGGMISVTWLQFVKALILLTVTAVVAFWALVKFGFDPGRLLADAASRAPQGAAFLRPGLFLTSPVDTISLGIALVFGVGGLPHLLMRFFTVPDKRAARASVGWAVGVIGVVYLLTIVVGVGARALLTPAQIAATGKGGNNAAPSLVQVLGGGPDSWGGQLFLAIFTAAAFATVLAYVAGAVITSSSAVSHDIFARVMRRGRITDREEVRVARITSVVIVAVGILLALSLQGQNLAFLTGLVYAMAASTNFPVLILAMSWRRFSTGGAIAGVTAGVVSTTVLIILGPGIWTGAHPPVDLTNPAIISVPLGFLACWLGSLIWPNEADRRSFAQFSVRAATGIDAERATGTEPLTGGTT
ncbi:MAG TPA: cation acetate symporter [Streptosporangiaceae bacterium]|jgi:cation/acetate symporter